MASGSQAPNYWHRPAKRILRFMFVDALRYLRCIEPLEKYRYVGMGSWEFIDFQLVRRHLGVSAMVSIEKSSERRERYEFNRPFQDIELEFGLTNEILPGLEWDEPNIVWLDYTSDLGQSELQDVTFLGEKIAAGSVLCFTLKCRSGPDDDNGVDRLERFMQKVGGELCPPEATNASLSGWGWADAQRWALLTKLQSVLASRGASTSFEQFLYVHYRDTSTPMMTIAGVVVDDAIRERFELAPFEDLEQYTDGAQALKIVVPSLSAREVLRLDDLMSDGKLPRTPGVEDEECDAYAQFHRWYPQVPSPV